MSDLPFGINSKVLAPSEIKNVDPTNLQTARAVKKTPFQKHKEEQERRKKQQDAEAKAMLDSFVASFEAKPATAFVSGGGRIEGNTQPEPPKLTGLAAVQKKFGNVPSSSATSHSSTSSSNGTSSKPGQGTTSFSVGGSSGSGRSSSAPSAASKLFSIEDEQKEKEETGVSIRKKAQKHKEIDSFMEELKRTQELREKSREPSLHSDSSYDRDRSRGQHERRDDRGRDYRDSRDRDSHHPHVPPPLISKPPVPMLPQLQQQQQHMPLIPPPLIPSVHGGIGAPPVTSVPPVNLNGPMGGGAMPRGGGLPGQGQPVQVVIPEEKLRGMIDSFADSIVQHGMALEQFTMQQQQNNPAFAFLFELGSPANMYYKWRVFSLLNGDSHVNWRVTPFQMFIGGPLVIPPPLPTAKQDDGDMVVETPNNNHPPSQPITNAPVEQVNTCEIVEELVIPDLSAKFKGKPLSEDARDQFEDMLRTLSPERAKIRAAMGFALDRPECAPEIVEVISESLIILKTPVLLKIARLYLVSDILHNTRAVANGSLFRIAFEETLTLIFISLRHKYQTITSRITQQLFKDPILKILRVWSEWCVFPQEQLRSYYDTFLDTSKPPPKLTTVTTSGAPSNSARMRFSHPSAGYSLEDIDGVSMTEEEYEAVMNESSSEEENLQTLFPSKRDVIEIDASHSTPLVQYHDVDDK